MATFIKNLSFIACLLLLVALSACGSDEDTKPKPDPKPDPVTKTATDLIAESWNIGKITLGGQELTSTSYSIKFNADRTFTFNTPAVPGLAQTGKWVYQESSKTIRLNDDTDLVVDQISETGFNFTYTYANHKMGTVEVKFTLKK